MNLTEVGLKHSTDKAYWHRFTDVYEVWLRDCQHLPVRILEIGIANGSSLKMWSEWFPKSKVVGVDILDRSWLNTDKIQTYVMDQGKKESVEEFLYKEHQFFDIIIDDGSHLSQHQMTNLEYLWDHLSSGGTYIIEDLHTSSKQQNDSSANWTMRSWANNPPHGPISKYLTPGFVEKLTFETSHVEWWQRTELPHKCYSCRKPPMNGCSCAIDPMTDGGGSITSRIVKK